MEPHLAIAHNHQLETVTDECYDDDEVVADVKTAKRKKHQHSYYQLRRALVELVVREGSSMTTMVVLVLAWNIEGGAQQHDHVTWPELGGCADPRRL